jgi:hypothetical protein
MTNKLSERGQALIVFVLLAVGVFMFIAMYMSNAGQNQELAETVGDSIDNALDSGGSIVTDIGTNYYDALAPQVVWTSSHAARHSGTVQDIYLKCNESTGNVTAKLHHPKTGRDAFVCFVEGVWVVTIKQFDPEMIAKYGDDVVTSFPGETNDLQWVLDYLIRGGYAQ